jgi:hypothetical protein
MTTPTVQRAPGTAFRNECGRIIATLIRHTGNQDLSGVRPRADATNRVPTPITHRGPLDVPEPPYLCRGMTQGGSAWALRAREVFCLGVTGSAPCP